MRLRTVTLRTLCGCTKTMTITDDIWRRGEVEILMFQPLAFSHSRPALPDFITPMRRRFVRRGNGEFLEQL